MTASDSALVLAADVAAGRRSAVSICEAALARVATLDGRLSAFLEVTAEHARRRASAIDADVAAGRPVGPLAGVPVAVKDNICTTFGRTTCGSKMLASYASPFDATVVERIERAGGIIIGKTNLDEFAMGSSTENSGYFPTRNPWDTERVPGGSSGGSAAAVAADMVPLALGSDTGGSIRQPASLCGIVGLKPTYGRVSRYGLVAYGSSLDQVGPLARTVGDAALMLAVLAGRDPHDSTSAEQPVPDYVAALDDAHLADLAPRLRIGVPREYFAAGLDDETRAAVEAALDVYRRLGAKTIEISLPHSPYAVATYYLVATAEASSNLARFDGVHYGHRTPRPKDIVDLYSSSRDEGFGAEVKRRIMLGTFALSAGYYDAYYNQALKVRRRIKDDFDAAFAQCDIIAGPTSPTPAFRLAEKTADPLQMYLADIYTIAANLAGVPAVSIPCGLSQGGLPIGLQLMAPLFEEVRLLQAARLHERETDWHQRRPAIVVAA
ncbi:MAG: Asp-tRNA(Asn)/Glu-tRNA(Gln) amidotransferase subunit GatA [Phycisphaerales bacterium]|nr:Asp-tRNA(Asn)/Glu-tRNA(Gln) amidotransferase subunit GatA [Phycisphaerales bacterium]